MARLQEFYKETVAPELLSKFGYKSVMEVPRITKITLNMGVGEAVADKKVLENAVGDMQKIAGQKPVTTKARKSIAGFKIRDGYPIGCMVTLRGPRMFEFLDEQEKEQLDGILEKLVEHLDSLKTDPLFETAGDPKQKINFDRIM